MKMKVASLGLLLAPLGVTLGQECAENSWSITLDGKCSYPALLEAYSSYLNDTILSTLCGVSEAEASLLEYLGNPSDPEVAVRDLCLSAAEPIVGLPSQVEAAGGSEVWTKAYYDGGTDWNEEVETELGESDRVHEPGGSTTNVLREDADNVKITYEHAQRYRMEYLDGLSNFETCEMNSVMCCWPQDRQANDNNGNCAKPYDTNCVDKDPADNTDLCLVHMERNPSGLDGEGISIYPGDNGDGEGAIHCHGFAWSNDPLDVESRYMGNNLFYVSMYDHMRQRGYARNIPGSPMCGCVEQMPVVTRSDCTQTDVTQTYVFSYDLSSSQFKVAVENIEVDFNSCQGLNDRNNDLSAYVARLVTEDKITKSQQNKLKEHLVENGNCPRATERNLASKGIVMGFAKGDTNTYPFTNEFPETDTDQFVHGFCVTGASKAIAFSNNNLDLKYQAVDFVEGVKAWGDRDYVYQGVEGSVCDGGVLLRPSKHKSIARYTDIALGMDPIDDSAKMCVLLYSGDIRHGRWPEKLFYQGFLKDLNLADDSLRMQVGSTLVKIETHCKTIIPPEESPPPVFSSVMNAVEESYVQNGKYRDNNYDLTGAMIVKNQGGSDYDRSGLIKFDVDASFLQTNYFILRLFVQAVGTDSARTVTVSRVNGTFDSMASTWRTIEKKVVVVERGASFVITPAQVGTWVEIAVSDLAKTLSPEDSHLIFRLDCLTSAGGESYVLFGTSKHDKAPQLVMPAGESTGMDAVSDAYVRDGKYETVRHGLHEGLLVKNDPNDDWDRKAIIQFDLTNVDVSPTSTGVLRLYLESLGSRSKFKIRVSTLQDQNWDQGTITWSNLDTSQVTVGQDLIISNYEKESWVEFIVSDLIQTSQTKITFLLENMSTKHSQNYVKFGSLESGFAPKLFLGDVSITATAPVSAPTVAPTVSASPTSFDQVITIPALKDTYIRGGIHENSNMGRDPVLIVKHYGDMSYRRKTILQFDASRYDLLDSRVVLQLYVESVGTASDRTIHVTRLEEASWDESSVTWNDAPLTELSDGPTITITAADVHTYVEIVLDSLVPVSNSSQLLFLLESDSTKSGNGVTFGSRESNHPPFLTKVLKYDVVAFQDAYVRGGDYADSRNGLLDDLVVKEHSDPKYDRKTLMQFPLVDTVILPESKALLRMYVKTLDKDDITILPLRLDSEQWNQGTITWNILSNVPTLKEGTPFKITKYQKEEWIEVDVTDLLKATDDNLQMNIMLQSDTDNGADISFGSMEVQKPPHLILTQVKPMLASGNMIEVVPTPSPTLSSPPSRFTAVSSIPILHDASVGKGVYHLSNYGSDADLVVMRNKFASVLQFDLRGPRVEHLSLRIHVQGMDITEETLVSVSRLEYEPWEEDRVTWDNLNASPIVDGNQFPVHPEDSGTWKEVSLTNLLDVPDHPLGDRLVLLLESKGSTSKAIHFSSKESGYAPYVINSIVE